jgi:hypothetical protein
MSIPYSRDNCAKIIEGFMSKITGTNLRAIGKVAGALPLKGSAGLLAKGIQAGAAFQANIIDPEEEDEG